MLTVDIHSNKETVREALSFMHQSILLAKKEKDKLLCLIVGYGSKGTRHKIQTSVLDKLLEYKNDKFIKGFIKGSDLDIFNMEYHKFPGKDLLSEKEKRAKNPGVIYVSV